MNTIKFKKVFWPGYLESDSQINAGNAIWMNSESTLKRKIHVDV
jgi:hypothetical protein